MPPPSTTAEGQRPTRQIWRLLGGVGLFLALAGVVDLILGLVPLSFGVPEWEFGSIGNFLNRLPMFALGLTMLLAAALAHGKGRLGLAVASILLLVSVVVLVFALLFATNLPVVLAATTNEMRTSMLKAVAKAAVQSGVYSVGFLAVSVYAIRASLRLSRRQS